MPSSTQGVRVRAQGFSYLPSDDALVIFLVCLRNRGEKQNQNTADRHQVDILLEAKERLFRVIRAHHRTDAHEGVEYVASCFMGSVIKSLLQTHAHLRESLQLTALENSNLHRKP